MPGKFRVGDTVELIDFEDRHAYPRKFPRLHAFGKVVDRDWLRISGGTKVKYRVIYLIHFPNLGTHSFREKDLRLVYKSKPSK